MPMLVSRLTPIGASSTWGRPMPEWYWHLRNTRQAHLHFGWGPSPVDMDECPYNRGTGICTNGCWEEPSCHTDAPSRYGWPRRPLDLRRPHRRFNLRRLR